MGEAYLFCTWDPKKGPIHPDSGEEMDAIDDDGKTLKSSDGDNIKLGADVRLGDLKYKVWMPDQIILDDKKSWEEVDWLIQDDPKSAEELKKDFPNKAAQIEKEQGATVYDYKIMQEETRPGWVNTYYFWHRPTQYFPEGIEIVFTPNTILRQRDYPYKTPDLPGFLPCIRFTSQDIEGEVRGLSLFRYVAQLQRQHNNLTTMIVRNQILAAHPKWMMPAGAASMKSLGNDYTVVSYKGPIAPQLVQMNPTPNEVFEFREKLKDDMSQLADIGGVAQGEPPPGITAAVALQFLDEKEQERFNDQIVKFQKYIVDVARISLKIMGIFYEDSDERRIAIVGENTGMDLDILNFDVSILQKDFDVRIQNSSSLPQSKAARTQTVIDLNEAFPDLYQREQVVEILDVAQSEKFIDHATVNINKAQSEDESMLNGNKPITPKPWEDHIIHYKTHIITFQDKLFESLPKNIQNNLKDHLRAHEMFLWRLGQRNPLVKERILTELPNYPVLFKVSELEKVIAAEAEVAPLPGGAPIPPGGTPLEVPPPISEEIPQPQVTPTGEAVPEGTPTPEGAPPSVPV